MFCVVSVLCVLICFVMLCCVFVGSVLFGFVCFVLFRVVLFCLVKKYRQNEIKNNNGKKELLLIENEIKSNRKIQIFCEKEMKIYRCCSLSNFFRNLSGASEVCKSLIFNELFV